MCFCGVVCLWLTRLCNFVCLCFLHTAQDVLVYLFGDSAVHLSVEGLGSVTVQDLGRSVREALRIPESAQEAFAFWLCSPLLGKNFYTRTFYTRKCAEFSSGNALI